MKNGTSRQGLAAQVTARLQGLGFNASNDGNAPPSAKTKVASSSGTGAAATTVTRVVKMGRSRVARVPQPGLAPNAVVLVLGDNFKSVASRVPASPPPAKPRLARPPKPTAATRDLPPWDPRPC